MHKVLQTGSEGNAIIYHGSIMVDIGIPYSKLKRHVYDINLVLLTHQHGDHINLPALKKLQYERPTLRIGCCEWMVPLLNGLKNIDVYEIGGIYDYGAFKISPIKLYHDVPNCGYRIFKGGHKTIHCTDTAHLKGITAEDYDLYAIEHNYNEDTVFDEIARAKERGLFTHKEGAISSHLSEQQAREFIFNNRKESSEVLRLHESKII